MLAEDQRHGRQRDEAAHAGPEGRDRTLGQTLQEVHPVERIAPECTAAIAAERKVERPLVDAGPDQVIDQVPLMNVARHEIGLDAVLGQSLDVLDIEGGRGIYHHALPGRLHLRVFHMGALDVLGGECRGDVPERGARRHRHEFGLGIELRQHVARVVIEPGGLGFRRVRREGDRSADLDDHVRDGFLHPPQQVVVVVEIGRSHAGGRVAHVEMQNGRTGLVAVDRRLHLLVPGERDVRGVAGQPGRAIGRGRDDQRRHVLGQNGVVSVVHCGIPHRQK